MPSKEFREREFSSSAMGARLRSLWSVLLDRVRSVRPHSLRGIHYNAFFTSAPAGLAILDGELHLLKANDTMADMIGRPLEKLVGQTPNEMVPLLAPVVTPVLWSVATTGRPALNFPVVGETPKKPAVIRRWNASVFPIREERNGRWTIGGIAVETTDEVAIEKLRKSQALLAQAEQVAHLESWEYDELTGEVTWSDSLCRLCGLDPDRTKVSKELYLQLLHPDDRQMVRSIVDWALKDQHTFEHEARYLLPNGQVPVLFTRGKPFRDESGRVVKWIGISQDVAERKEAERALRESEDRYRDLVENSHELICTHDLEGRVLSMNELPARILGYRRDDLIARRIPELLSPKVRRQFKEYIERIKREGSAKGLMQLVTRSGETRIWEYDNTLRTEGVPAPVVRGMAHDATEKIKAQRVLRENEARLQALIGSIDEVVFELDATGKFVNIWTRNEGMLVRPREEMLGRRLPEFTGEDFFRPFQQIFQRVLQTGRAENLEYPMRFSGWRALASGPRFAHSLRRWHLQDPLLVGPRHYRAQTGRRGSPAKRGHHPWPLPNQQDPDIDARNQRHFGSFDQGSHGSGRRRSGMLRHARGAGPCLRQVF